MSAAGSLKRRSIGWGIFDRSPREARSRSVSPAFELRRMKASSEAQLESALFEQGLYEGDNVVLIVPPANRAASPQAGISPTMRPAITAGSRSSIRKRLLHGPAERVGTRCSCGYPVTRRPRQRLPLLH